MQAKSDEQLATEKAWLDAERLWLVHRRGFTAVQGGQRAVQNSEAGSDDGSRLHVRVDATQEVVTVDDDDVEKVSAGCIPCWIFVGSSPVPVLI